MARPPTPSCLAEYASVTAGRTPGVTDQDLRRSEAWHGNRRRLTGVIGLSSPARRRRPIVTVVARESISLGHGVVPGGACGVDESRTIPIFGRGCGLW